MIVIATTNEDGHLGGIYSSWDYAKLATYSLMERIGGEWRKDEREHECRYNNERGHALVLDEWEVDRALIGDHWCNLSEAGD